MRNNYQNPYPQDYQQMRPPYPPQQRPYGYHQQEPQINKNISPTMTVGKWIGTMLLMCIPLVNIVCFFVFIFGGGNNRSRTNFYRAGCLFSLLPIVAAIIIFFVIGTGAITGLFDKIVGLVPGIFSILP